MMIQTIFSLKLVLIATFLASCANVDSSSADKQIYRTSGVIKKINAESNTIAIYHEDIPGYMAAMEMDFTVGDKAIFENARAGDRVEFEFERTGENIVITRLNKIGEAAVFNGAEIYNINCSGCHGAKGEGGKKGISLVKGHALHHTEAEHIKQVTSGEGEKMPPFRDKLSTDEIAEVVKFVRTHIQKDATRDESRKHKH
jgi:Cu/Ag efflux protein CusF